MSQGRDDVLILGAGVIGLSCALELLKAGRGVTLIDAGRIGGGSSHGNCGTITPSHAVPLAAPGMIVKALRWMLAPDAPLYVKPRIDPALAHWLLRFAAHCNPRDYRRSSQAKSALLHASRALLEANVRDEGLQCEFASTGSWYVYRDAAALAQANVMVEHLREFDVQVEVLDGAAAEREEPALREGVAGALSFAQDAMLRPDRYVAELARRVRERGGAIVTQCAATGFSQAADGRIDAVRTVQGSRSARDIVLALGAWAPKLARGLGLPLPIQPGKGYSITYTRPERAPRRPLVLRERSVCVTAWKHGYRLGSTMEFSGYDETLNRVRLDALARGASEYLHQPVGVQVSEEWYGWRPMTWDDLPIIGRSARAPNLMLAAGHGMLGVSLSSITGRLVAELIEGRAPSLDPSPYSPRRFAA